MTDVYLFSVMFSLPIFGHVYLFSVITADNEISFVLSKRCDEMFISSSCWLTVFLLLLISGCHMSHVHPYLSSVKKKNVLQSLLMLTNERSLVLLTLHTTIYLEIMYYTRIVFNRFKLRHYLNSFFKMMRMS